MAERGILKSGEQTNYGFGQFFREYGGLPVVSHSGKIAAYLSYVIRFPQQRLAVVLMSNAGHMHPTIFSEQIASIYLDDLLPEEAVNPAAQEGEVAPSTTAEETSEPSPAMLESYVGHYRLDSGKLLRVTQERGGLMLHKLSSVPFKLVPISPRRFRLEGSPLELSFETSEAATLLLVLHIGGATQSAARTQVVELLPAQRAELTGTYLSDELGTLYSVEELDGKLFATHSRHPDTELVALGTDSFQGADRWLRDVRFQRNAGGDVTGFRVNTLGIKNLWFRKIHP
jgi:hypothetical protein